MSDVPAVTSPALPPDLPDEFELEDVIAVARELAMNIKTVKKIREDHGLSEEQFEALRHNPFFERAYTNLVEEWGKIKKTEDRIKFQALAGLEDGLPDVLAGMSSKTEVLTSRIEAAKLAAKLAGVGTEDKPVAAGGDKFVIQISVGGAEPVRIEKNITPPPMLESATQISAISKGPSDNVSVQAQPEGNGNATSSSDGA